MATIEERLQNVRTLEDIVYLLTILFTNLNNQNKMYYDMFLNPVPMDLELERYDENGELVKVTLANRAKDRIWVLTGEGNPNGSVAAKVGTLYLDLNENSRSLYFKSTGSEEDTSGWQLIYSYNNLNYLAPDGDASELQNVNADSITMGTLKVPFGGTGTQRITSGSLIQGNGQDPFSPYNISDLSSLFDEFIGMIMYSSVDNITGNWLICDGTEYNINERPELTKLFNKIGNKYGGNGVTTFKVPNLISQYIKCGSEDNVGSYEDGIVGSHTHSLKGNVGSESSHTHGRGSYNITGSFQTSGNSSNVGAFYGGNKIGYWMVGENYTPSGLWHAKVSFDASRSWTGSSGAGSSHTHSLTNLSTQENSDSLTNEVNHTNLIPVIRY